MDRVPVSKLLGDPPAIREGKEAISRRRMQKTTFFRIVFLFHDNSSSVSKDL
jgi:hypothetical protein